MRLRKLLFCTLMFIQREGWLTKFLKEVTVAGISDEGNRVTSSPGGAGVLLERVCTAPRFPSQPSRGRAVPLTQPCALR